MTFGRRACILDSMKEPSFALIANRSLDRVLLADGHPPAVGPLAGVRYAPVTSAAYGDYILCIGDGAVEKPFEWTAAETASPAMRDGLVAIAAERERKHAVVRALPDLLVPWYDRNKRDLPWRRSADPYRVWLSEIMLQQTRVEAVREYFNRFVRELPDVAALAACPDDRLLKLWEGLGYYSRARNLKKAAAAIVQAGAFPNTRAGLATLPGIGDYTAGAVASIAFGLPEAAVDGNVLRVAARAAECFPETGDTKWRKALDSALSAVYPTGKCAEFTQSFMDLGATVCLPESPRCEVCPLAAVCLARARGSIARLPVRTRAAAKVTEYKTVFVLTHEGKYAVQKRADSGLLAGLWEFPNVAGTLDDTAAAAWLTEQGVLPEGEFTRTSARHVFTHRVWEMRVYTVPCRTPGRLVWRDPADPEVALPTAFRTCLPD